MIHGMVDRPLVFTLEELKRLPSVTRGATSSSARETVPCDIWCGTRHCLGLILTVPGAFQALHGETSCSEWTGVELSLLLRQAGVQKGASWIIAEGAGTGKHTKSIPLTKAMDDALIVYGQNGEAVRPDNGYPLRLLVPGFEGVNNVKWLRRIKLADGPYYTERETLSYISTGQTSKQLNALVRIPGWAQIRNLHILPT